MTLCAWDEHRHASTCARTPTHTPARMKMHAGTQYTIPVLGPSSPRSSRVCRGPRPANTGAHADSTHESQLSAQMWQGTLAMRTQCRLRPVPCAENTPEFPRARVPVRAYPHDRVRMRVRVCMCARARCAAMCFRHARWSAAVLSAALTAGPDGPRAVPGAGGSQTWTTPFMFALVDTRAITSPANALYLRSGPPHTPACPVL
jgi:hypothetical protein